MARSVRGGLAGSKRGHGETLTVEEWTGLLAELTATVASWSFKSQRGAIIRLEGTSRIARKCREPFFSVANPLPWTGYLWIVRGRATWRIKWKQ